MQLSHILSEKRALCLTKVASKKNVLEIISTVITKDLPQLDSADVFNLFIAREKLGSTAIGHGVALPHLRMENIDHVVAVLIQLDQGIEFDSPDDEPVDLFCALLVPAHDPEQHLEVLAYFARLFSNEETRQALREAKNATQLFNVAIECSKKLC